MVGKAIRHQSQALCLVEVGGGEPSDTNNGPSVRWRVVFGGGWLVVSSLTPAEGPALVGGWWWLTVRHQSQALCVVEDGVW